MKKNHITRSFMLPALALAILTGSSTFALAQDITPTRNGNENKQSINPYSLDTPKYTSMVVGKIGDDLGDHIATQNLDMSNHSIYNISNTINRGDMATNKNYVDAAISTGMASARDNLGNHTATRWLNMNGFAIAGLAASSDPDSAVRKDYVDALSQIAGSTDLGYVQYNGITRTGGVFYGGSWDPTGTRRLNYSGYLYATRFYSTMYLYFSDERLKRDIKTVSPQSGMDIVRKMRPVSYAWKQTGEKALGVIAQETEKVIPTAVKTNESGIKAVDYNQIISPMLAAIQDLDSRVKKLEAEH